MCPHWFSKHYCFENCNYKASHLPEDEVPEDNSKAYKTYLNKIRSWCHRPGPSVIRTKWEPPPWNPPPLDSQSNRSHGGCTSNTTTVNECGSRECVPKRHWTVRSGCKSNDCSPKMHSGNSSKTACIWLDWGANPGLVSQKCIRTELTRLDQVANPGLLSRNCIPTWLRHRKLMRSW